MTDPGLAAERTTLARARTSVPFLVVAALGTRAALDAPLPGLVLAALACAGALLARRSRPTALTALVVLLAAAAAVVPGPT